MALQIADRLTPFSSAASATVRNWMEMVVGQGFADVAFVFSRIKSLRMNIAE